MYVHGGPRAGRGRQRGCFRVEGKPQLGRWAFYWEGVFGAAQNVGRFWCRYSARLLSPVGLRRAWMVRRALRMPYAPYVGSPDPTQCVGPSRTYGRMVRMAYVGVPNYRG
eukprot:scaffold9266_cov110-Isochrysis_galbana.AAC.7